MVNVREALILYEEVHASHYQSYRFLRSHALDIFESYAELRTLQDCVAAVRESPIYYKIDVLLRVPEKTRSPRDSGLNERMKEKRDCCHRLVMELEIARMTLQMEPLGVLEEHDFAEQPGRFSNRGCCRLPRRLQVAAGPGSRRRLLQLPPLLRLKKETHVRES